MLRASFSQKRYIYIYIYIYIKELCGIRKIQKEKAIKSRFQLSRESQLYPRGQKGDILNIYDYAKDHPFVKKKEKTKERSQPTINSLFLSDISVTDTKKQTHTALKIRSENGTWKLERHFRARPCERRRTIASLAAEE